ncbi:MAG: LptE family protein [Candidatus Omnitrophota bacterium]
MINHRLHRFNPRITQILLLSTVFCLLSTVFIGCGYTTRSMISNEFKTIYIQPFVNKIDFTRETAVASKYKVYRPHLEAEVTKAVIDKYLFDGNLKPVDKQFADLILKADLVGFRKDPLRYTADDDVEEYRVNIVVNMTLWNVQEDKPVWEEHGFTGDVSYFVTGPLAVPENTAVNNAIKDLARRIVERTVEQW